jgi:hypothetical protein
MWQRVNFFDQPTWAWRCPDDLLAAFNLAPPPPNYCWAQLSDDAPWRLWQMA